MNQKRQFAGFIGILINFFIFFFFTVPGRVEESTITRKRTYDLITNEKNDLNRIRTLGSFVRKKSIHDTDIYENLPEPLSRYYNTLDSEFRDNNHLCHYRV